MAYGVNGSSAVFLLLKGELSYMKCVSIEKSMFPRNTGSDVHRVRHRHHRAQTVLVPSQLAKEPFRLRGF